MIATPLATHVDTFQVNNDAPSEAKVEASVRRLRHFKAGGNTHLHAEHLKKCLSKAYPGESFKTPPRTERWMCLTRIVQHMWRIAEIPQELGWTVLVLIPKGSTDTWVIGLLETLWKAV